MFFYYLIEKLSAFTDKAYSSIPGLPTLASNACDEQWITVSVAILTVVISVKLVAFTENWALHVDRDNSIFGHLIIPSKCLKVARMNNFTARRIRAANQDHGSRTWSTPGRTRIKAIVNPPRKNWKPLLVFANTKSGNGLGKRVLAECRQILHPLQVHDLAASPPQETLKILNALPDQQFMVLICGGDGTINWLLAAIDELAPRVEPLVALLPLGTGNDLSRALGWGAGFTRFDSVRSTLAAMKYTDPIPMDRWKVKVIEQKKTRNGMKEEVKNLSFQNYFSIGVDAACAYDFHRSRDREPFGLLRFSRHVNKLWWGLMGFKEIIDPTCANLSEIIELELDGRPVQIPSNLEGINFLNIWSWAGGCPVWRQGLVPDDPEVFAFSTRERMDFGSFNDGRIEVMGFTSSFHLAQCIVNLADPIRLGQVKTAKIRLLQTAPMQADGEPWRNQPCTIELQATRGRIMLKNKVDEVVRKRINEKLARRKRNLSSTSLESLNSEASRNSTPPPNLVNVNRMTPEHGYARSTLTPPNFFQKQSSNTSLNSRAGTVTPIMETDDEETRRFFDISSHQ